MSVHLNNRRSSRIAFICMFLSFGILACSPSGPRQTVVQVTSNADDQHGKAKQEAASAESKLTVAELIDKLVLEANLEIGYRRIGWAEDFIAIDSDPKTSPVMRELVRRGVAALPELIEHLDDKRYTESIIDRVSYANEYDFRFEDSKKQPAGVVFRHKGADRETWDNYDVCVGDFCYFVIGQIVDRDLRFARRRSTGSGGVTLVNSPVATPTLAAAVKQDWAGLTAEQHKQSLLRDAVNKVYGRTLEAIVRLLYYYPQDGEIMALRLLARPIYDGHPMSDLVSKLTATDNSGTWASELLKFEDANGKALAEIVPFLLFRLHGKSGREAGDDKSREEYERATRIIARYYSEFDPDSSKFIDAASCFEQAHLIDTLSEFRSEKIDQAVSKIANTIAQMKPKHEYDREAVKMLSETCKSYFAHQTKE